MRAESCQPPHLTASAELVSPDALKAVNNLCGITSLYQIHLLLCRCLLSPVVPSLCNFIITESSSIATVSTCASVATASRSGVSYEACNGPIVIDCPLNLLGRHHKLSISSKLETADQYAPCL